MAYDPVSMAFPNIQADMMRGQRDMQMADMFANSGYVQNSGPWGVLAQMAQAWAGGKLAKRGEERIADALRRQFEEDTKAREREAEQAAKAEEAAYQRDVGRRRAEKSDPILNPQTAREPIKLGNQLVRYNDDGTVQKLYEVPRAPQADRQPTSFEVQMEIARQLGATPEQLRDLALGQKPAGEMSVRDQIALRKEDQANQTRGAAIDNAMAVIADMEAATKRGVGGPVAGSDWNPLTSTIFGNATGGQDIEKFNADASALQDELSRIQRIPGIGTQTDFELRQMMRAMPTASMSESTRTEALARIRKKLEALKISGGEQPNSASDTAESLPVDGAKKAPDGNWYLYQNGQYLRVDM